MNNYKYQMGNAPQMDPEMLSQMMSAQGAGQGIDINGQPTPNMSGEPSFADMAQEIEKRYDELILPLQKKLEKLKKKLDADPSNNTIKNEIKRIEEKIDKLEQQEDNELIQLEERLQQVSEQAEQEKEAMGYGDEQLYQDSEDQISPEMDQMQGQSPMYPEQGQEEQIDSAMMQQMMASQGEQGMPMMQLGGVTKHQSNVNIPYTNPLINFTDLYKALRQKYDIMDTEPYTDFLTGPKYLYKSLMQKYNQSKKDINNVSVPSIKDKKTTKQKAVSDEINPENILYAEPVEEKKEPDTKSENPTNTDKSHWYDGLLDNLKKRASDGSLFSNALAIGNYIAPLINNSQKRNINEIRNMKLNNDYNDKMLYDIQREKESALKNAEQANNIQKILDSRMSAIPELSSIAMNANYRLALEQAKKDLNKQNTKNYLDTVIATDNLYNDKLDQYRMFNAKSKQDVDVFNRETDANYYQQLNSMLADRQSKLSELNKEIIDTINNERTAKYMETKLYDSLKAKGLSEEVIATILAQLGLSNSNMNTSAPASAQGNVTE